MTGTTLFDDRSPSAGEEVPEERQRYLVEVRARNARLGQPPYSDAHILSRLEVTWIFREEGWSGELDAGDHARGNLRGVVLRGADLREIGLVGVNFSGSDLCEVNLAGADLTGAILRDAYLSGAVLARTVLRKADLSGSNLTEAVLSHADLTGAVLVQSLLEQADLSHANLTEAIMRGAQLRGANLRDASLVKATLTVSAAARRESEAVDLSGADLEGADLSEAILTGAIMREVNLSGANLSDATLHGADLKVSRMNVATVLARVALDTKTQLGDVVWNDAPLAQVDWDQAPTLGDELAIAAAVDRRQRAARYRDAARTYRGLAIALRGQGLLAPASRYRWQEQRLERQANFADRKLGAWMFSGLLDLVSGYGEAPARTLRAYVVVVATFALVFLFTTHFFHTQSAQLNWYESLVLSVSSFHGRGFFPTYSLGDPVAVVAALEAISGLFIELVFIATFSRRFLGS